MSRFFQTNLLLHLTISTQFTIFLIFYNLQVLKIWNLYFTLICKKRTISSLLLFELNIKNYFFWDTKTHICIAQFEVVCRPTRSGPVLRYKLEPPLVGAFSRWDGTENVPDWFPSNILVLHASRKKIRRVLRLNFTSLKWTLIETITLPKF